MNDEELRLAIFRGRRITRDPGILAILDETERRLNEKPVLKLRGNRVPDTSNDARINKSRYMKIYMRSYRARKKQQT